MTTKKTKTVKIGECGNGLPDRGEIVLGGWHWGDPILYRVLDYGPIHTARPGEGNYYHAEVEPVDEDDVDDDLDDLRLVSVGDDDDDDDDD